MKTLRFLLLASVGAIALAGREPDGEQRGADDGGDGLVHDGFLTG